MRTQSSLPIYYTLSGSNIHSTPAPSKLDLLLFLVSSFVASRDSRPFLKNNSLRVIRRSPGKGNISSKALISHWTFSFRTSRLSYACAWRRVKIHIVVTHMTSVWGTGNLNYAVNLWLFIWVRIKAWHTKKRINALRHLQYHILVRFFKSIMIIKTNYESRTISRTHATLIGLYRSVQWLKTKIHQFSFPYRDMVLARDHPSRLRLAT